MTTERRQNKRSKRVSVDEIQAEMINEMKRAAIDEGCELQAALISTFDQLRLYDRRLLGRAIENTEQKARWKPVLLPHPNWLVKWRPPEPLPEAAGVELAEDVPTPTVVAKPAPSKVARRPAAKINTDVPELDENTPLWQRVMAMWKKFYTPTEIAKALDITIDDVQNAKRFARQMAAEQEGVLV